MSDGYIEFASASINPLPIKVHDNGDGTYSLTIIGSIDITSIVPGVGATDLGKAEDAVAGSGDTGVALLAVRTDTPAATAGNGDYHNLHTGPYGGLQTESVVKIDPVNDAIMPYSLPASLVQGVTAKIEVTTIIELLAAGGTGLRNYVTSLVVTNSDATVGTVVEIRDGTTTVLHRGYAAPLGGGWAISFPTPLKGTAATAVNVYCMTNSAEVYVSCTGFQVADPS